MDLVAKKVMGICIDVRKIYIWSILLSPLYYLHLGLQGTFGFGVHLPRVLELFVIIILILSGNIKKIILPNYLKLLYVYILYVFISIIFIKNGDYSLYLRENIINMYYIFYYVILFNYMINNLMYRKYFYHYFYTVAIFSLFIAIFDFFLSLSLNYNLISRHLFDDIGVGRRLHGIFGEPRDAFVVITYILFVMTIYKTAFKFEKHYYLHIIFYFLLCLLTGSTSGFLSLILFIPFFLYLLSKFKIKLYIKDYIFFLIVFLSLFLFMYEYNARIQIAIDGILQINNDNTVFEISSSINSQKSNIYPLLAILEELKDLKFFGFILGHGGGQSGYINYQINELEVAYPQSQLVRILYDYGIVGTFIFISAIFSVLSKMIFYINNQELRFYVGLTFALLLASALMHRSVVLYIAIGIMTNIIYFYLKKDV